MGRSAVLTSLLCIAACIAAGAGCAGAGGPSAGGTLGVSDPATTDGTGTVRPEPRRLAGSILDGAWAAWQAGDVRDAVDAIAAGLAAEPVATRMAILRAVAADVDPAAGWKPGDGSDLPGVPGWAAARLAGQRPQVPRDDRPLADLLVSVAGPGSPAIARVPPRVDPEDAAAALVRFRRAADAVADGRLLQAVVELREAGRLDPSQPSIQRSLARVAEQLGNASLARVAWQDLLAIDRADPEAVLALAADALRSDRPLASLALLARLEPETAGGPPPPSGQAADSSAAIDAWCRDALLMAACERLGADEAIESLAERMLASAVHVAAARRAARERSLMEAAAGRIEIARRLGDARWRGGRPAEADAAYAMAGGIASSSAGFSAADRRERAAVLVRHVALAAGDARHRDVAHRLQAAAAAMPDDATAVVLAMHLAERSPAGVRQLALVAGRLTPAAAARATAAAFPWPDDQPPAFGDPGEPIAAGFIRRAQRIHPDGPPWPHPLPELAVAASRCLHRADRPLSVDGLGAGSPLLAAAVLEACGWLGRAWTVVDGLLEDAGPGTDRPPSATIAAAHVLRIHLAGLLQEPELVRRAIDEARLATTDVPAGWVIRRDIAAAMALARVGHFDEAVRTASDLVAATGGTAVTAAAELDDPGTLIAAARLTLAAALVERAMVDRGGSSAAADVRSAVAIASGLLSSRPADAVSWMLIESVLAPSGPVPDPAASARQRRRWADVADGVPAAAREADRLERARLMAAGRFEAVDDAARLRLAMDPLDETAIEDLLAAQSREGRGDDTLRWLEQRQRRHPADPAAAAVRLRLDAEAGRAVEAWSRLEQRLAADPGDLVALRLAEAAAGFAGDRMMQLVMAETRLLERPPGPHRGLLLARAAFAAGRFRECLQSLPAFIAAAPVAGERDLAAAASLLAQIRGAGDAGPAATAAELEISLAEAVVPRLAAADAGADAAATAAVPAAGTLERIVVRGLASAVAGEGCSPRTLGWVDRLAEHAERTGVSDTDVWRSLAGGLLELGRASEAATVLARRVLRGPEQGPAVSPLLQIAVATDAAVGSGAATDQPEGDRTASLLRELAAAGRLPAAGEAADDPLAAALREAAITHRWLGSDAGADSLLAAALRRRPGDASLLNDLGYARLEAAIASRQVVGRDPAIAGLIERAHALDPANAAILDSLGWLRYRQGRIAGGPEDAVALLERAAESGGSPSAEVLLHLGDARWRAGRREAAVAAWRAASELLADPSFRGGLEQDFRQRQFEVWGVLVRDPAAMYHESFGRLAEALRMRLEAERQGADPMPVVPTDAEESPVGDGP